MAVVASPIGAAISELLPSPGAGAARVRGSRRLHSAPSSEVAVGMRRWPLPESAEPCLVVRPAAPRKISSLPALTTGFAMRSCKPKFAGRLRSGSVPLHMRGRPQEKAKEPSGLRVRSSDRRARLAPEPGDEAQVSPTCQEARFHVDLKRVGEEVREVRKRQLSTRNHLQCVRLELSACEAGISDEAAAAFKEQTDAVKAEVSAVMDDFMQEWDKFRPVSEELQALGQEVDSLTDTDQRMSELMNRMSRKLDAFDQTLGRDLQYWG